MVEAIVNFILGILADSALVAGVLAVVGFLFREAISKYLTQAIESKFSRKLEETKAEFRANERKLEGEIAGKERELSQINDFLSSLKLSRTTAIQNKKMLAAESTFQALTTLSSMSMAVEMVKIMKLDVIAVDADRPGVQSAFREMTDLVDKDNKKLASLDGEGLMLRKLYLDQTTQDNFDAYRTIVTHAFLTLKFIAMGAPHDRYLLSDALRKTVTKLAPASKDGFEKYGHEYAFYWTNFFYDRTLQGLRAIANGLEQDEMDAAAARGLVVATTISQGEARQKLLDIGLPKQYISDVEPTPEVP